MWDAIISDKKCCERAKFTLKWLFESRFKDGGQFFVKYIKFFLNRPDIVRVMRLSFEIIVCMPILKSLGATMIQKFSLKSIPNFVHWTISCQRVMYKDCRTTYAKHNTIWKLVKFAYFILFPHRIVVKTAHYKRERELLANKFCRKMFGRQQLSFIDFNLPHFIESKNSFLRFKIIMQYMMLN